MIRTLRHIRFRNRLRDTLSLVFGLMLLAAGALANGQTGERPSRAAEICQNMAMQHPGIPGWIAGIVEQFCAITTTHEE